MESSVGEQFTDMCEALGLQQHVTQPTHISGHILDLVITKYGNSFGVDQVIHDTYFLDHSALIIGIKFLESQWLNAQQNLGIGKRFQHWNWLRDFFNQIGMELIITLIWMMLWNILWQKSMKYLKI